MLTTFTPTEAIDLLLDPNQPELAKLKQRLERRLIAHRTIDPITQCWLYNANTNEKGYSRVSILINGERYRIRTHRFSYRLYKGYASEEDMILHTCDNTLCFNPDHLFIGDDKANQQDRISKGRIHPQAAKLTTAQVLEIRQLYHSGWTRRAISVHFNVHYTTIRDIINGRYWSGGL